MAPAQLFSRLKRQEVAPAYLLLGPEVYQRGRVKQALLDAGLRDVDRETGATQYDLSEHTLAQVIDDARSLSLFASRRVIVITNAEAVLPRGRSEEETGSEEGGGSAEILATYMRDPSPGVLLIFEAVRFAFEGEDKAKQDRVRRFYSCIPEVIELRRPSTEDARLEAEALVHRHGLGMEPGALELLVEALGADLARISVEIEKLSLYRATGNAVTSEDIALLVPDARATTIFALVSALGRRDRLRSLALLDTLFREGEYLPLALAFLSTQFRLALAAKEAGLRSAQQIQSHFSRLGVRMWGPRAEQIQQTVSRFSQEQLERAVRLTFDADVGLRSPRPDDRIVMERFVLAVTA